MQVQPNSLSLRVNQISVYISDCGIFFILPFVFIRIVIIYIWYYLLIAVVQSYQGVAAIYCESKVTANYL